jgi:hypothetical protein
MMNKLLTLLIFSFVFSAYAEDMPVADAELKKEMIEFCKEMAEDESVAAADLQSYLLTCVNNELESEGYAAVTKL